MPEASPVSLSLPEAPWRAGWRAARANLAPGLVLWAVGSALVFAYYHHAPTHAALERLTDLHTRMGLLFSFLGTMLCGGLLPILYLRLDPAVRADYRLKNCLFLLAFWGYKGVEIELFYRVLAHVVGADNSVRTIAIKAAFDQFVYSPFFAVPVTVLVFSLNHAGLRFGPVLADIRSGHWYRRHVLPTVVANAALWIPMVCLVYALPLALQTLLFDLGLCYCILLVAHITRRKA
jgi:hypothetical protein